MNKIRWKSMEFRVLYSKMWQCSTTLSCSGVLNGRWCCSILRNDRAEQVSLAFSLPSLRSSVQVSGRISLTLPEIAWALNLVGVPCLVIGGKELVNKGLAKPPPPHPPFPNSFCALLCWYCCFLSDGAYFMGPTLKALRVVYGCEFSFPYEASHII